MTVWGWLGFDVIIYLAALQGIPEELLEAAEIDGASRWTTFRSVVVPLLGPATLFLVVWSTINALQLFDEIYVTTRGGPLGSTTVIVYYLYQQAFQYFNAGYGAAVAYVLFVGDPDRHADPTVDRPAARLLHAPEVVRSRPQPLAAERLLPLDDTAASSAGAAAVQPLAPVLAPIAAIMLLPLVWMVVVSLETTQPRPTSFPPVLLPAALHFSNYSAAWNARPVRRLLPQQRALLAGHRRGQPAVLQPRRLRLRAACASSGETCCSWCCWRR